MMVVKHIFMWLAILLAVLVLIVLILWLIRWWVQGAQFQKNGVRMTGKVVIITGANSGCGKEVATDLARRGARVYMACRNQKRSLDVCQQIIRDTGNSNVFFIACDLASYASIRSFVTEFLRLESRLDVLVNNAGVMFLPRSISKDGYEIHLAVNHLGHFLLTNLLLDTLKASMPSRVINVSCALHRFGRINRDDFNMEKIYNQYDAYFQSKLANILFTRGLAKRLLATGVTANSLHPGVIVSELQRFAFLMKICLAPLILFMRTAKSGAQTIIALAVDPELEQVSGRYFQDCRIVDECDLARDDEMAEWLWQTSEQLTSINSDENVV